MFAQSSSMDWNAEAVPTHKLAGSTWICAPLFAAPRCRAASSSASITIVPPGESDGDKGKGKMESVKKEEIFIEITLWCIVACVSAVSHVHVADVLRVYTARRRCMGR